MILGVATITAFLFLGSEDTIDSPRLGDGGPQALRRAQGRPGIPVIRIAGGAPPPSGPRRLRFSEGSRVRLRFLTDSPARIAVLGYGVEEEVTSSEVVSFRADRRGQFAVVAADSRIGLASITVVPR